MNQENDGNSQDNNSQSVSSSASSYESSGLSSGPSPGASYAASENQSRFPAWAKIAILVAIVALGSVGYLTSGLMNKPRLTGTGIAEMDPDELAKRPPVAEFILTDAAGKQKKLSEFRGNVVILSFWASWCAPCLVELPTFGELEKKYQRDGLHVLAVNVDEGDDGKNFAKEFWAKNQFPFPAYFDTSKALAQQFEVDMLPSNFVIDRQGRLVFSGFGANDWNSDENTEFIEGLLREPVQEPKSETAEPASNAAPAQ